MSEPPRKRTRSVMSPEERKEARAHRNRIAAQNSRDRRKAHFAHLERRVAELEEENRHLRAGLPASPSPSVSEPEVVTDHDQSRKRAEEQRERENQQLRERIRALEIGYRTVVRALADQGKSLPSSSHPPFTPLSPSSSPRSPSPVEHCSSPSAASATLSSINPTYPLSPTPTHSTLVDSPLTLAPTSLDLSFSPAFSPLSSTSLLDSPSDSFDLSLSSDAPTRHLARVATTAGFPVVPLQRVGSTRTVTRSRRAAKSISVVQLSQSRTPPRTPLSRVCSRRSSRRHLAVLALFRVLALRQKRHAPRRR